MGLRANYLPQELGILDSTCLPWRVRVGARALINMLAVAALVLAVSACGAHEATTSGAASSAATSLPQDVRDFVACRRQCDHYRGRGEEANDVKRQAFLDAKLKQFCSGTDRQLTTLRARYKADKAVTKALSSFDAQIE